MTGLAVDKQPFRHDPIVWLMTEFEKRRLRNKAFSLRAFARHLDVSPGQLSDIFSRKRLLTLRTARQVAGRLGLSPTESAKFFDVVKRHHARCKRLSTISAERETGAMTFSPLSDDRFRVIADWYHFAILNLIETHDFQADENWIAQRLGISSAKVRRALDRLRELNLVVNKGSTIVSTGSNITTTHDLESKALKVAHAQSLRLALRSLMETPVEKRDITAITMAIDVTKIRLAKNLIRKFRRDLADLLESDERSEVYELGVAFFPLSKRNNL